MKKKYLIPFCFGIILSLHSLTFADEILLDNEFSLEDFDKEYQEQNQQINDPLESYNRFMHDVNWAIYDYFYSPVVDVYTTVTPKGARLGVYNFFDNLSSGLRFVANLLQFRPQAAADEFGRFVLNTVFGFGGVFDIATPNGLYAHEADFGTVLGTWGIEGGFHLVLPLLGPSNLRDALMTPLNVLAQPTTYLDSTSLAVGAYLLKNINYTARHKNTLDTFRNDSLDSYILMRNAYEQNRESLIKE